MNFTVDYYIRHDSRSDSVEEVVVHAAHEGAREDPCTPTANEIDLFFDTIACILRKLRAHIYPSPVGAARLDGSKNLGVNFTWRWPFTVHLLPVQDLTSDGEDVNKDCELLDSFLGRIARGP